VLVEGIAAPDALIAEKGSVSWIDQTGAMLRVAACGGTPTRTSPPGAAALGGFAGPKAFVLEAGEQTWLRSLGESKGYEIVGAPNSHVLLAASEKFALWVKPGSEAPVGIHAAAVDGGPSWVVVDGVRGVTALAVDDSALFYGTTETVFRASLEGSAPVELVSRPGGVVALAPTLASLLVTFRTGGHLGGGAVTRIPKGGGLLLTLASEREPIAASVLADDGFVYFATRADETGIGGLRRVNERGGIVETLGEVKDACAIAVDEDVVLVGSCRAGRGAISRIPKPLNAARP
jgi:hypothetical protein